MKSRTVRVGLHGCTLSVLAAVLFLPASSGSAGTEAPTTYGGTATATGFHATLDTQPQLTPIADLFHIDIPFAQTDLDSTGSASARAATLFPGEGVLGIPGLICFSRSNACPTPPPKYPLMAEASHPSQPDDTATASGQPANPGGGLQMQPSVVRAHADLTRVAGTTKVTDVELPGVTTIETIAVRSKQLLREGSLVARSETVLGDIDLGDVVHIDSVRSMAEAEIGGAKPVTRAGTVLTGVTVAGVDATIDENGVHANDQGSDAANRAANKTIQKVLDGSGISAHLLRPTRQVSTDNARVSTAGLVVNFRKTVEDVPPVPPCTTPEVPCGVANVNREYFGTLTFGGAGVNAHTGTGLGLVGLAPQTSATAGSQAEQPGKAAATGTPAGTGAPGTAPAGDAPQASDVQAPQVAGQPERTPAAARHNPIVATITSERLQLLAMLLLGYPALALLSARSQPALRLLRRLGQST